MIEVLYGIQNELIDSYVNNYIKKLNIYNIIKIDYEESNIDDIVEEASCFDLFGDKKALIIYNAYFLTAKGSLDSKIFESYLSNPNPKTIMFLVVNSETLDERKKVLKLIKKSYKVKEFNKFSESEAFKYVKESFKKYNYIIDELSIKKIVEYLSINFGLYDNEINKLKLYKYDEKVIELQDVLDITSRFPEDNVFKLVEAVINNQKEEIFSLFSDIKSLGTDEISLLALLSSQFRFMYQVKVLMNDGKTKQEIITILASHPYKTEMTMKKVGSFKEEKILDILHELALIDVKIKTGEIDKTNAIENFFLNL